MCRAADRLSHLCVALNLTTAQFTDLIGLPLQFTRTPSRRLVARILQVFPQVAAPWLLTGEGPMLLPGTFGNYIAVNYGHTTQISTCTCTTTISALQAHLEEKERFIQLLLLHAT